MNKDVEMENFNSDQFAHLNPDTECAAFEQVCSVENAHPAPPSFTRELKRSRSVRERMLSHFTIKHEFFHADTVKCTRPGVPGRGLYVQ